MSINKERDRRPEEGLVEPKKEATVSRGTFTKGILGAAVVGLTGGYYGNEYYRNVRERQNAGVPSGTNEGTAQAAAADATLTPKVEQLTPKATGLPKPVGVAMTEVPATPTVTGTPKVEAVQQAVATQTRVPETNTSTPLPTRTPTATETPTAEPTKVKEIVKSGVRLINIPEKVDSKTVDVAKAERGFKNTIGLGTEAFVAEPGGLLVGPDFGSKSKLNPYGYNPEGWDAMYNAGGSIKPFSSVSQGVIRWGGAASQNLPEGGFVFISAGQMTAEIGDVKIEMPYKKGNNYFFVSRGVYPDGHQDTDQNRVVKLTEYKPGFVEVTMYESRVKTNLAFISEGQLLQKAETSHSGGTNCGAEGCSGLTVVFYDANTQAVSIVEQVQGRFGNPKEGWKVVWKNW